MKRPKAEMKSAPACVLAGDIGGTKTRLGLFVRGKTRPLTRELETFTSREACSLEEIIDRMRHRHPAEVETACFGIAGPVIDGECRTTNLPWVVSEKKLRRRFGWRKVRLMNDLSATAMAVPLLAQREMRPLNGMRIRRNRNIGLIAPGTGLGMALLVRSGRRFVALASEGGHAAFAPSNADEADLWRYLTARLGRVSLERVVSGPGLVNIYNWLKSGGHYPESDRVRRAMRASDAAEVISANALDRGDPLCLAALRRFCSILGAAAGDLALTGMTTGGVFLGGGIPPKILPVLEGPDFLAGFTAKGRFKGFAQKIAVRVILNDRAALLGAAHQALSM